MPRIRATMEDRFHVFLRAFRLEHACDNRCHGCGKLPVQKIDRQWQIQLERGENLFHGVIDLDNFEPMIDDAQADRQDIPTLSGGRQSDSCLPLRKYSHLFQSSAMLFDAAILCRPDCVRRRRGATESNGFSGWRHPANEARPDGTRSGIKARQSRSHSTTADRGDSCCHQRSKRRGAVLGVVHAPRPRCGSPSAQAPGASSAARVRPSSLTRRHKLPSRSRAVQDRGVL